MNYSKERRKLVKNLNTIIQYNYIEFNIKLINKLGHKVGVIYKEDFESPTSIADNWEKKTSRGHHSG